MLGNGLSTYFMMHMKQEYTEGKRWEKRGEEKDNLYKLVGNDHTKF